MTSILYVWNVRFPSTRAHSTQIAHMCEAFVENGAKVDLVVIDRKVENDASVEKLLGFVPSFAIHRVTPILFASYSKIIFLINDALFALSVALFYKPRTYDVIYVRAEWLGYFMSFFVPARLLVYESHEAKYNFPARRLLKKGVKCVCISEGIFNEYIEKGVAANQMTVAHDGIDDSFFNVKISKADAKKRLGLDSSKKVVMYIGGFESFKGVELFFTASELVKNFSFVAIGGNDGAIENKLSDCRMRYPNVNFLGYLPYKDLKFNQQAADILVIPNSAQSDASAKHTSPLKLFTYMASGVPILASSVPSLKTVLKNNMASFFKPDDVDSFVEGLNLIMNNYPEALEKAQLAKTTSRDYTWQQRAKNVLNFVKG